MGCGISCTNGLSWDGQEELSSSGLTHIVKRTHLEDVTWKVFMDEESARLLFEHDNSLRKNATGNEVEFRMILDNDLSYMCFSQYIEFGVNPNIHIANILQNILQCWTEIQETYCRKFI